VISRSTVLVDGVVRASHRFPVGLMDVVSMKELGKHYRVLVDKRVGSSRLKYRRRRLP
jgi:small subunit ribosomal protein S4e